MARPMASASLDAEVLLPCTPLSCTKWRSCIDGTSPGMLVLLSNPGMRGAGDHAAGYADGSRECERRGTRMWHRAQHAQDST